MKKSEEKKRKKKMKKEKNIPIFACNLFSSSMLFCNIRSKTFQWYVISLVDFTTKQHEEILQDMRQLKKTNLPYYS